VTPEAPLGQGIAVSFRGGGVRPAAWLLLAAALVVGGVAVLTHGREPAPAGPLAPAAGAKPRPPASVPLPGSVSLAAIPLPLPGETATGGTATGDLTVVGPPPGAGRPAAAAPGGPLPGAGLPPVEGPEPGGGPAAGGGPAPVDGSAAGGVPAVPLAAYRHAEQVLGLSASTCQLRWPVLAAIGRAETDNARGGRVDVTGRTIGQFLGPRLDGSGGRPRVPDTDRGELDGDSTWDRAVGPMQLLPAVWRRYGADGDGDGRTDPNDIFDAALTAGRYLCAGGPDLADPGQLGTALYRYRHSAGYVTSVRAFAESYAAGTTSVPPLAPVARPPVVLPAPGAVGPSRAERACRARRRPAGAEGQGRALNPAGARRGDGGSVRLWSGAGQWSGAEQ
jgi:hypothetical protein